MMSKQNKEHLSNFVKDGGKFSHLYNKRRKATNKDLLMGIFSVGVVLTLAIIFL